MYDELVRRLRSHDGWALNQTLDEAADAIEELQDDNAALNGTVSNLIQQIAELSKPHWIPVTERLPLYGQDVLAVRTYGDGEKFQEVLMAHISIWNEETGEKWRNATNITHWMPLPEPPKGE